MPHIIYFSDTEKHDRICLTSLETRPNIQKMVNEGDYLLNFSIKTDTI